MNNWYKFVKEKFPEQYEKMQKYGRRNVSFSTIAPTGSLSIIAKATRYSNISSGLEPVFMPYYMRRKKVNPGQEGARVDFTDQNGDTWQEYPVLMGAFKDWYVEASHSQHCPDLAVKVLEGASAEAMEKVYKESPWYGSTAPDIDWVRRVEIQGVIQKYISHSISSTINLPSDVSEEEVAEIYLESWKKGLKGITVYRDGSRSGVLVSNDTKESGFEYKDATKRPKSLEGDVHWSSTKGVTYKVIVGILEGKPYEIFIDETENKISGRGTILKKSKGNYFFKQSDVTTDISSNMSDEQEAVTRLISTSLRHGANIKFLVEQLNKTNGDMFTFTRSLARVLKKYIPDGTESTVECNECGSENVIFQEGCQMCQDCGNGKCG